VARHLGFRKAFQRQKTEVMPKKTASLYKAIGKFEKYFFRKTKKEALITISNQGFNPLSSVTK
jgi:hypothetical protein